MTWLTVRGRDASIQVDKHQVDKAGMRECDSLSYRYDFVLQTRTEDIFNGENTKAARLTCPGALWKVAVRKLDQLDSVTELNELRIPPGNRLESLTGNRGGHIAFGSMINIESVSRGPKLVPSKSKLLITTE